ncbi:MAG TPA: hypothetical protein DHV36_05630 [Desulfobacteraceae bacterium]|nr:hypothetical protein [Desulfobacteraceae bacterium]
MTENPTIVFLGAGAVGASIGAWVAPHHDNTYFLDIGEVADAIEANGITHYLGGNEASRKTQTVKVIRDLDEIDPPDIIAVAVKNYSLDAVCRMIRDKAGDTPVIIGLQNGVENQEILPQYFSKVIYGVVCYNAWLDSPGVVGYQTHGPLVLGTARNECQFEMDRVREIFSQGLATFVSHHIGDASHTKMIVNLTNSLTTLIGHTTKEISDPGLFQKLLSNLTYEGVKIVKAAGYKECKLGGMPSWTLMRAAATLPRFVTRKAFEKNVKKMVISSMAQDILQKGRTDSELETLNGYFISLADKHGVKAPYNRTIYDICRKEFAKPGFIPWDVTDVWEKVEAAL